MATDTGTQADHMKRTLHKLIDEAFGKGNLDVVDETHSEDAVWHGPGGKEVRGRGALKEMMSGYATAFPDMRMTVEHAVAEGDVLAAHWRVVGTHDGPLGDIPPTGRTVDIRGHIMSRFEDGKIVEEFEVFDELGMLQQLGLAES